MIWKSVKGYEGMYEVSSDGDVRRISGEIGYRIIGYKRNWNGRTLKKQIDNHGYERVWLCKKGEKKCIHIHTLVATAFHGNKKTGLEIAHLDGNKLNNKADNLTWATHKENESHKILHGTLPTGLRNGKYTKQESTPRGDNHRNSKLTSERVRKIKALLQNKIIHRIIAKKYKVSRATISYISRGERWAHITI